MKIKNLLKTALFSVICATSLAGCNAQKTSTTVTVVSILNKALSNVNVNVFDATNNVVMTTTTNEKGQFNIPFSYGDVKVKISGLPDGHYQDGLAAIEANTKSKTIKILTKVIEKEVPENKVYKINDIMYDYEFVDTNGYVYKLSETLKTKELVLINFWASYCGPCKAEFPFLNESYMKNKDSVEVFALSSYDSDYAIGLYKRNNSLYFPMGCDTTLWANFGIENYPTSILVNKYGIVTYFDEGAIGSTAEFDALFEKYKNMDFGIDEDEEDIVKEPDIPDIQMPDSSVFEAAVSGENFNSKFWNETNENDAKYNWPWVVSEDGKSMKPSNSGHQGSYSIIYTSITLNETQVFAFDYKSSCEYQGDALYVLVDRKILATITGVGSEFETAYLYAPITSGTHEVAFAYYKNNSIDTADDTVYVKNLRVVSQSTITDEVQIFRWAFDGYDANENKHTVFVNPVYNEEDGYYHVGKTDGPLLLANLMDATDFAPVSIYGITGYGNPFEIPNHMRRELSVYCDLISEYAMYQNNSLCKLVPVTQELKEALLKITEVYSGRYENEWLELCAFYSSYNMSEMPDPIKGLAPFSSYDGKEGVNSVNIDRLLMPRGVLTKFVPDNSGVYHIYSLSYQDVYALEVDCWLYDAEMNEIDYADFGERYYMTAETSDPNFSVYHYLEAGKTYYVCTAFANLDFFGDIVFAIEDLKTQSKEILTIASPSFFETTLNGDEMTDEIIAGGYDVSLEDDGYYHVVLKDGSIGGILYADFLYNTGLSISDGNGALSLQQMINYRFFDFSVDELGNPVEGGVNRTDEIKAYLSKIITSGELKGCVPVDSKLAELLQQLMDKYTFKCDHSWTKLCYFYKVISK